MTIKPIGEGRDVFGRSPEVTPSVAFPGTNNEFNVRCFRGLRPFNKALRLLQRHDLVIVAVDNECRRKLVGYKVDGRNCPAQRFASLGSECLRTKRHLQRSERPLSHSTDSRPSIIQKVGRRKETGRRLDFAALTFHRICRVCFSRPPCVAMHNVRWPPELDPMTPNRSGRTPYPAAR